MKSGENLISEFLLGGLSAATAGFCTNPLEVIKTRIQLQGELKSRGNYQIHYRNIFHACFVIIKNESFFSLQKGLVPALNYQFFMNGVRFGIYQCFENLNLLKNKNGNTTLPRTVAVASIAGLLGSFIGSPFYMIKTRLQSKSNSKIAVGYQHDNNTMLSSIKSIYIQHGIKGLWKGSSSAMIRTGIGSTVQITAFSRTKIIIENNQLIKTNSWLSNLCAAFAGGLAVVVFMTPFDLILTRLYNQPIDSKTGKGLIYLNMLDAINKIIKSEGIFGFYKGCSASFIRTIPHSVLSLLFWQEFRKFYFNFKYKN